MEEIEFVKFVADGAPVGLILTDRTGCYRYINPKFRSLFGYDLNDLPDGRSFMKLAFPVRTDRHAAVQAWREDVAGPGAGEQGRRSFAVTCKDGSVKIANITVVRLDSGDFLLAFEDITSRQRAEEALQESEARLRSIFKAAPVGIGLVSNRLLLQVNDRICEMTGYGRAELVGKSARILYPTDEDFEFVGTEKYAQIRARGTGSVETKWQRKDGTIIDVLLSSTPLDPEDHAKGVTFTALDITDQKRAVDALRRSEERLDLALKGADLGMWDWHVPSGTITVNDRWAEMLGYSVEEIAPDLEAWKRLIHPEDLPWVLEELEKHLRGELPFYETEHRLRHKSGEWVWVLDKGRVISRDAEGNPIRACGTHLDITKRKRLEAQITQGQKMTAIGTLAGGIAHDFNNLLMGIQGYTSLMLFAMDPHHPHHDKLRSIEELVRSGAELTKQLLGFARGGRYEVKPLDVREVIERGASMFGRTKKEITIRTSFQNGLWAVEADRGQIDQVLLNLYVNAWQAMPGGGELYIDATNVVLDETYAKPYAVVPGRYVKISVTDTGVGMDEKTRGRIFEPFFTTKEMGRGTGLGLASVYGIVKGHGGLINVYSEPGSGTTFTIYLPASERESEVEKPVDQAIRRGAETILLVDDEPAILSVSRQMLESLGYRVTTAAGGREALRLYGDKGTEIDLVIVDMVMPELSGGETFTRLRELNPSVRVILSSGYSLNGQAQEILNRGCDGFIQKPFNLQELSRKIRDVLDR